MSRGARSSWFEAALLSSLFAMFAVFCGVTGYNPSRHFQFIHWGDVSPVWAFTAASVSLLVSAYAWPKAIQEFLRDIPRDRR